MLKFSFDKKFHKLLIRYNSIKGLENMNQNNYLDKLNNMFNFNSIHLDNMNKHLLIVSSMILLMIVILLLPYVFDMQGVKHYLLIHNILEIFSVVIASLIFAVGWTAHSDKLPANVIFLSILFFTIAILDISHLLSYPGMPDFITPGSTEKAINFWLAGRSLAAFGLFIFSILSLNPMKSSYNRYLLFFFMLTLTVFIHWIFLLHEEILPHTFIPGYGLTNFKIYTEYIIIGLNLITLLILWKRIKQPQAYHVSALFTAISVMAMSEFFFTLYTDITDVYNLAGHIYKVISYIFIYKVIFVTTVRQPYELLNDKDEKLLNQYNLINNIINTVPVRIFWKDKEGTFLGANKLFLEDTQLKSVDEIIGKNDFEMPWGKTEAQLYRDDDISVMNSGNSKINFEESQTDDKGNSISVLTSKVPLEDEDEKIIGLLGTYVDITKQRNTENELKKQKDILYHQAHHDSLTGLPNRLLFSDRLEQTIQKAKRNNSKIALLFIDLDRFKEINDSLGHDIGDEILKEVTYRLSETMRKEDTVARLGGDEFTVVLEDLSQGQDASLIATKILENLAKAMHISDNVFYVSSSIGISIYPDDGVSTQDLLKYADSAMYKAKDEGRNNFQYYNSTMTELAFERVEMETSLRSALKNNEFVVYYQPQVNGITNKLIGMEALVRWQHPTMGLVSPAKFIPLAESTGLIVELDRYVMRTAVTQIVQWYKEGLNPGMLAMNLAVKQLQQKDFIPMLKELMQETNCKTEWIELEVTEGQIMTHPEEAILILQKISDLGIELAVDDFGTGYSSLAYLKKLPIDKLKIDQVFIRDLPDDEEDAGITKAVIALANSLNLKVIAEGVETKEQKDFLVENGCKKIQGYFYSKPVPANELERLLRNGF
ncbi:MAG: diguanylate cyclase (GGDEF)-like protein/PAS domain S-box-containing protein [Sulfurimonas sp.]|jgi:diguanylate cyclase (GGDEF)-like protein/PAS domain S-box-containing protein